MVTPYGEVKRENRFVEGVAVRRSPEIECRLCAQAAGVTVQEVYQAVMAARENVTMLAKRIIPCLDVTDGRVVKGVNFVDLRDAGDPVECAKAYEQQGADELVFLDITASSDGRDTMLHIVERCAEQVFMPLTVGGGIRTAADTPYA